MQEKAKARRVEGFPIVPRLDFVYVVDYGQPDRTRGGIFLPEGVKAQQFYRYRFNLWRYGQVVAVGPGRFLEKNGGTERLPMPEVELGDVVVFSRKHGTRLGTGWKFQVPGFDKPLLIRVLDPMKVAAVLYGFDPWWNVELSQLNPDGIMTG